MKKKTSVIKGIYALLFGNLLVMIFFVIPLRTDLFKSGFTEQPDSFSENWAVGEENIPRIEEVLAGNYNGRVRLEKNLPNKLTEMDSLCFESQNTNVEVLINDKEAYSFKTRPNLTGTGTGIVFHEVGIGTLNAGKKVTIVSSCCYEGQKTGRILNVYICPSSDYMRLTFQRMMVPSLYCALMILFGIILILIYCAVSNKDALPFNILALGVTSLIAGTWLFIDTNIMQLLTGAIYAWRDMNKVLPFLVGYPLITFFNSLTVKKNDVFQHIGFWMSAVFEFGIIAARYILNLDMCYSFSLFLIPYLVIIMIILLIIAVNNANYCRRNGLEVEMRNTYLVIGIVLVCGLIDLVRDFTSMTLTDVQGKYTMFGMVIFVIYMMIRFLKWWTKDHAQIQRERFINHALQYALSSDSPEYNIKALLDFMGKELEAERIFIFEDQKNGKYRGSYEWSSDGLTAEDIELVYLPYEGVLDKLYEKYISNGRRFIINNIEQLKTSNPYFYDLMKNYGGENIVIGALEINGKLTGICGVMDAPRVKLIDISEIINLISYFLSQLILQREEQKRLFYYNYNDVLSGARNHMAYRKFMENGLDMAGTFGYMRVDIKGLEEINKEQGYDAGDKIVIEVARSLMEIFGEENVYRLNGNEFVCFGFETEEPYFDNDVECARRMIEKKGVTMFTGSVYCANGTSDMEIVLNRVDELLEEDMKKSG
ncbi:GGDEF domain-containing protein [Butyrivibrio sp. AE3004]|uniref:GGDEF domain-containing protein n=1 Tax=Butyrivibrio sp. AE3004 TaxID=1506994 RepID=UPI000494785D|nr:GGDEF domain-containing protein [Butyrivibrio sp. AE3004]